MHTAFTAATASTASTASTAEVSTSTTARRASHALTGLALLFLLFDSAIKLLLIGPVVEAFDRLGFPDRFARALGVTELACIALCLVPRTAVLGAVLLTGFLGGAVAVHLRIGDPLLSHTLFPIYVGALIWSGLWLRDPRVRALVAW